MFCIFKGYYLLVNEIYFLFKKSKIKLNKNNDIKRKNNEKIKEGAYKRYKNSKPIIKKKLYKIKNVPPKKIKNKKNRI